MDTIPTVHMGPAVTQMERRGIQTNIGNLNRDIRAVNRLMKKIRGQVDEIIDRQERERRERERERDREQNKGQKPTSVLQQKLYEARQKLREQRVSKKNKGREMER